MNLSRRGFLLGTAAVAVSSQLSALPLASTGFEVPVNAHLIRSQIWAAQIKEMLLEELTSMKFKEDYDV